MDALTASLVGKNDWRQEQVGVVLATAYFLSHCDLVTGNMLGLVSRLDSIRELIRERWDLLSSGLTGVSARLLLWLAYLDLRRSESLPRLYLRSRLYLKEAFGESYPSLELRDDMIQDPVNLKFAEGMSILGKILQHARHGHENTPELRDDLESLHSEMIELERECDLALQGFDSGNSISITRTSYHWLNLKATTQCGLILLSRMRNKSYRTDDEAQSAAHKILKITIQLGKANKLHNPHSVFSVLPTFLAGIETVDEVHQDWIMRFLEDARGWGLHVQRAAKVLHRAVERQKQTGCRLGFKDIADLASEQLVL
uniref:Transcription factor domain-containing protein n=1 Tax=Bionectria ochroleuca TaxID=29856 RepID=A0A0B7KLN4_BIOOC